MKPTDYTTIIAGLDIGKLYLDADLANGSDHKKFANKDNNFKDLVLWLRQHKVTRIGMEATGGYERNVAEFLINNGFEVVIHQPFEVKRFAQFMRARAKNDKADAKIIAQATASKDCQLSSYDKDLSELSELMTLYEHTAELLSRAKAFSESLRLKKAKIFNEKIKANLAKAKAEIIATISDKIKNNQNLKQRAELLKSIPGIGEIVAASLLIRVPELGHLNHGQAASLIGVAPFDRDSGAHNGKRIIGGGRARPRRHLYIAALAAKRKTSCHFKIMSERLKANGKPPKVIIVAIMRKIIEAANLVLKRNQPWTNTQTNIT